MFAIERYGSDVVLRGPEGQYSIRLGSGTFTGMGWDAQSGSALLHRPLFRSALLLGLGGGTAARQLRLLSPEAEIVGVEIDPEIMAAAVKHFGVGQLALRQVVSCGERYLRASAERFDFILDDMWDHAGERTRAITRDRSWLAAVRRRLTPSGIYAVNIYTRRYDRGGYDLALQRLQRAFAAVAEVSVPGECVTVLVGMTSADAIAEIDAAILTFPRAARTALRRLRFRDVTRRRTC